MPLFNFKRDQILFGNVSSHNISIPDGDVKNDLKERKKIPIGLLALARFDAGKPAL